MNFSPLQEMVFTLFSSATVAKAKEAFKQKKRIDLEVFEIDYTLNLVSENCVTLETGIMTPNATDPEKATKHIPIRQVIGVYSLSKGLFSTTISLQIPYKFWAEYESMKKASQIKHTFSVTPFSTIENAIIAALSIESFIAASESYIAQKKILEGGRLAFFRTSMDINFTSNGFICDMVMSNEGYPQFFLDDKYGVTGPIAVYLLKKGGDIEFSVLPQYKELVQKLKTQNLLTIYE